MPSISILLVVAAIQGGAPPPPRAPGPYGRLDDGSCLAALALAEAEHARAPRDAMASDTLGILRSFVGDDAGALEVFETMGGADRSPDPAEVDETRRCIPEDALAASAAAAKDRQVVILNEAHHVPLHRAFSLEVARALRKQGFEWFAAARPGSAGERTRARERLLARRARRILVQAFLAGESDDAVPVDQVVLQPGEAAPVLLLPEGEIRLVVQDESGREIARAPLVR